MTDRPSAAPGPAWQLLAQVVLPGGRGSAGRAADLAVEVVRHLHLPPAQAQLIRQAVADAAHQVGARPDAPGPALPISVAVLISSRPAGGAPGRQGWGCFVIKHLADGAPAAEVSACDTIELYLYPEGGRDAPD